MPRQDKPRDQATPLSADNDCHRGLYPKLCQNSSTLPVFVLSKLGG